MNLFASVTTFVLAPLFVILLYWGAILLHRISGAKIPVWGAAPAIVAGAVFVCSLMFTSMAHRVDGTVVAKNESIETATYGLTPAAYHHYDVVIQAGGDAGSSLTSQINARAFDRLRTGDTLKLLEVALGPLRIARPAGSWWISEFPVGEFDQLLVAIAWPLSIAGLLALTALPWLGASIRPYILVIAIAALATDLFLLRAWWLPMSSTASAEVLSINTVREAQIVDLLSPSEPGFSRHPISLPVAYDELQLAVRLSRTSQPVLALDRVDTGTAGTLKAGQSVMVVFPSGDPRDARMTKGRRSYALRNSIVVYGVELVLLLLFGVIGSVAPVLGQRFKDLVDKRRAR